MLGLSTQNHYVIIEYYCTFKRPGCAFGTLSQCKHPERTQVAQSNKYLYNYRIIVGNSSDVKRKRLPIHTAIDIFPAIANTMDTTLISVPLPVELD